MSVRCRVSVGKVSCVSTVSCLLGRYRVSVSKVSVSVSKLSCVC